MPGFIFDNIIIKKLTCSDRKSNRFAKVELLECGLICLFFVTVGICTVPLLQLLLIEPAYMLKFVYSEKAT